MKKLKYFLCGLAMGAADTVPGVSGGTIAFITGIYTQLLNAVKAVNLNFFSLLFKGKFKQAFRLIPWDFCIPLVLGIGIAIFSLASLVVFLLENHENLIWAFFFGLILSSLYLLVQEIITIKTHVFISIILFILGSLLALWLTFTNPISLSHTPTTIFFSGFIAICAMILPGISGSFILVLLGQYQYIIQAVSQLNFFTLLPFALGAILGLISFSHLVSYCLNKFYQPTLAFLSGILAGSLVMLFPYYEFKSQSFSTLSFITLLIIMGFIIPLVLNLLSKTKTRNKNV